jgi:hypothetical protein
MRHLLSGRPRRIINGAETRAAPHRPGKSFKGGRATPRKEKRGPALAGDVSERMKKLRTKILPARNKLGAHADRDVIRKGNVLGQASFQEWEDFWSALKDFVRIINEKLTGKPFEIDAAGVLGDAEMLIKALWQSRHFETLLRGSDKAVVDACLKVAMPQG